MAFVANKEFVKTKSDIFPAVESVVIPAAIFVQVYNDKNSFNALDVELVGTGDITRIAPGETKFFNATSNTVDDELNITFYGPSKAIVNYTEGANQNGASLTNIDNKLSKKQGPGCIIDLANPSFGSWPGFPFDLTQIFFEIQGIQGEPYQIPSHTIQDTEQLCVYLNKYQKLLVYEALSATTILAQDGWVSCRNLNEFNLSGTAPGAFSVQYTSFTYDGGQPFTSWGDSMNKTLGQIHGILRGTFSEEYAEHYQADFPVGFINVKKLSFIVLNGSVDVRLSQINLPPTDVNFPIVDTDVTLQGFSWTFNSPGIGIDFLNPTGEFYVSVTKY